MPKMMKNVQQMSTMLPMGFRELSSVWTTSFRPGALEEKEANRRLRKGGGDWKEVQKMLDSKIFRWKYVRIIRISVYMMELSS